MQVLRNSRMEYLLRDFKLVQINSFSLTHYSGIPRFSYLSVKFNSRFAARSKLLRTIARIETMCAVKKLIGASEAHGERADLH